MSLLEIIDGEVTYTRRGEPFVAIRDVNLAIAPGDRVGIVGGSGSGKTTIARLMLGLVQPSAGEVRFGGRPIAEDLSALRRAASLVFQDPNSSLNPRMRVGRIIEEPLRRRGTPAEIATALEEVGLEPGMARRFPHQLSGGQRQRVAIARALIADPQLLVADEPVSALDVLVRAQVLRLIRDEADTRRFALAMISHDLTVVRQVCNRVVVVHGGAIVEEGPVGRVFDDPQHEYTRRLLDATLTL
ncbi:MAG: ATP-binding cassette domain-containing protein [Propionibacterium sp.]|nr:ATP-binding cassette domain-containing protein [Propionibacterium sp.]